MDYEKLVSYQQKTIDELESQIEFLKQENDMLNKNMDEITASYNDMKATHDAIVLDYKEGIKEINKLKQELTKSLRESIILKEQYNNDMQRIMKKIKKNNRKIKLYCSVCGDEITDNNYVSDDDRIICKHCMEEQYE